MKLDGFDYELPERLIAQAPLEKRDASRMLVYHRDSGITEHRVFSDIGEFIQSGDCLVINETKVFRARLHGMREGTGGAIEFLLLRKGDASGKTWQAIARPAKRALPGRHFAFGEGLSCEVLSAGEEGIRTIRFDCEGDLDEKISALGEVPLPPYIHSKNPDLERYNTVYATQTGSAAAPTAGLHFTPELLDKLSAGGVDIARILLHVGLGTFRPVKEEEIEEHVMHTEHYEVTKQAAGQINKARAGGHRIVAVGTTCVRTLESAADDGGFVHEAAGETGIFIYPGYKFKAVDALLTNFHLPKSTLIMLVSAFMGREEALEMYKEAVRLEYRFYSFGDCCLIL